MPNLHFAPRVKAVVNLLRSGKPVPGLPETHDIDLLNLLNALQAGHGEVPPGRGPHMLTFDLPARPPRVRVVVDLTRLSPIDWRLDSVYFLTQSQFT